MYTSHFGLTEPPFSITPDTSFFYGHSSYQDALNTLLVSVRSGEGFIKVVGEVGTGKTLLCRKLLSSLEQDFITAYVPNPYLEPMTLLLAVADELGVAYGREANQHQVLKSITAFLVEVHSRGRRVVLCLDEAQAMPIETLEALRLLSNLETERRKLLQVVLFGQPELDVRLDDASIRQLRQRISFSCKLGSMSVDDVEDYVAHRLGIAGYRGPRLFSRQAVQALHRASRGVPRLVNVLAHKAMIAAFGEGARVVGVRYVKEAIADTESTRPRMTKHRIRIIKTAAVFLALLLVSAGMLIWGFHA
ncbi:MAG: ExeA family protein [Acidiferrobacterales bacterium]